MLKVSFFLGEDEQGVHALPLFGPADPVFEKTAAPLLLPEVVTYISMLKPRADAQYVLLNAMGGGEYWGSNINGDFFPEAALIHKPDNWQGVPAHDKVLAADWPYGFPTFYSAHPYAHHRNKDATKAFGEVELAAWNPRMKRVELVARVDKDKCERFGGVGVWDKLRAGDYPDVSMGCKVPYDTCSICLDWDLYRKAQATFIPGKQKSPGEAVLVYHKALLAKNGKGIRGVSITRKDYCDHALRHMNAILPDGRKVFVYNDYPRFFDISFVFVGADKTAKTMLKIASSGRIWSLPSAEVAEKLGYDQDDEFLVPAFGVGAVEEKTASAPEEALKTAFLGKLAKNKSGEITKDVVPSQFAAKAVPALTRNEQDLPHKLLDALGTAPLESSLSTTAGLGMLLRPREFQRIILIQMGKRDQADELDRKGVVFPKADDSLAAPMSPDFFSISLAQLLLPMLMARSALGPAIEKRVLLVSEGPKEKQSSTSSLSSALLRKIGAAYNGYRTGVMELVTHVQDLMASAATPSQEQLHKLAMAPAENLFTPLAAHYLKCAFWDEVGVSAVDTVQALANVERGLPSRNTPIKQIAGGH